MPSPTDTSSDLAIDFVGHAPLERDPAAGPWRVATGTLEVFAVPRGASGPRRHLLTVRAGGLVFGLGSTASSAHGLGLLGVGGAGTRLVPAGPLDGRPELAADLDAWLLGLAAGLGTPAAPKGWPELPGDGELAFEPGLGARVVAGVSWVEVLEGRATLFGPDDPALEGAFPLPEPWWFLCAEGGRLRVRTTSEVLAEGAASAGLRRFHEVLLQDLERQGERSDERERERLLRRRDLDQATLVGAQERLASVLSAPAAAAAGPVDFDPLLLASRRVAAAAGLEIRERPPGPPSRKQGDALAQICSAARIQSRRVLLRDDWWWRDNGPLVAFRIPPADPKARQPVALLPISARSYDLVSPDGSRQRVDEAVAESLSGDAFMFYPALPARPVDLRDLARLAFAGRRKDVVTLLAMGVVGGVLSLLVPILTGQVFGSVIPSAQRGQLFQVTVALLVAAVAGGLFQITRSLAVLRLGGKVDGVLQSAVWDRLLALPVAFFRRYAVGDLANRALGIDAIRELLTGNVLTVALSAVFSVFSFALLFRYSLRLALLATAMALALMLVTAGLVWLQLRHQRAILDLQGRTASLVFGLIHGIGKLRVAGAEARAFARWAERFAQQRRRALAAQRVANVQTTFNSVFGLLTSLGIFAMVGLSREEGLPLGDFLAFNAAFGQFLTAALSLVGVFSSVLAAVPVYERLKPILATVPEVDDSKADPGDLLGTIEFSHVSFRYHPEGADVLTDVSFRARAGEFIALVGPSGSGKSTSLRLILGFERPSAGAVYFDGQDLAGLSVRDVRRQIGVVLQNGRLLAGSLYSNIVGSANLGVDAAWAAARAAGLDADIESMPMGMHTVVSEGAETFSGGQKQRLLIARAIVHRPRILLFDEATSALDNRTQEIVSRSLERLQATRIVIAHRLSTIQNADRIYVIEGGRVAEEGTYAELLARGGTFTRLAERQLI
jgi:ATP-binding cassette subfamily C protein